MLSFWFKETIIYVGNHEKIFPKVVVEMVDSINSKCLNPPLYLICLFLPDHLAQLYEQ